MQNPLAAPVSVAAATLDPSCMDDFDPSSLLVEQALGRIHSLTTPVAGTERVAIREALGRVLAEPVHSSIDVPAHDNSAMDGYAVRSTDASGDVPTVLRVLGTSWAGRPFDGTVGAGECVRIMTGAVMPAGADAVVIQEKTRGGPTDTIRFEERPRAGDNVREAGEDIARGAAVLAAGQRSRSSRARGARIPRHGRGDRPPPGTGRVLLDGGRAPFARRTARGGLCLRQQPLHPSRHAARDRGRGAGPRGGPGRARGRRRGVRGSRRRGRRDRHLGRRFSRRGGLRQGDAGEDRRGGFLEDRDEARPAARVREGGRRALLRPSREPGVGDGDVLPVRPAGPEANDGGARGSAPCVSA